MPSITSFLRAAVGATLAATVLAPIGVGQAGAATSKAGGDAVVVAVIDSGISPYHWDFLASKMPQARDKDRSNDLPLGKDPATWLKGFPTAGFKSKTAIKLSLEEKDDSASIAALKAKDEKAWASMKHSNADEINYYWFPGTKVIGGVSFGYSEQVTRQVDSLPAAGYNYKPVYGTGHGQGTSSVSVGNFHGTCPECLIVAITAADTTATEQALAWAQSQPWIDVVSNSYGLQTFPHGAVRDGLYGGQIEPQKKASERGQTIVFSAGNGVENGFVVPFSTLTSSVKGPDWVITVGATVSGGSGATASGSSKPVDVSGIGMNYPSAYNSTTTTNGNRFSGTSNAAPTVAGTYARGLFEARRIMAGASRTQSGGVISVGKARCGKVRPNCEVGDGKLTAVELRDRLLKGAKSTGGGTSPGGLMSLPRVADEHYLNEGHGTYYARLKMDDGLWMEEFNQFFGPVLGTRAALARPADEAKWFTVDSWCRQHIFGTWNGGYYRGASTPLPPYEASAPTRAAYAVGCNALVPIPGTPRP